MKNYLGNIKSIEFATSARNADCVVHVNVTASDAANAFDLRVVTGSDGSITIHRLDEMAKCYFDFSDRNSNKSATFQFQAEYEGRNIGSSSVTLYYSIGEVTALYEMKAMERAANPEQPKAKRSVREFQFIGKTGAMEKIFFYGKREREGDFSGTYVQVGDEYRKVHTDFNVNYKQYTGAINADKRELVYVMAQSPNVWVIEQQVPVPVTVLDVDVAESEPHEQPIGLSITYRYSNVNLK